MKRKKKRSYGFTLIEVILCMIILSVTGTLFVDSLINASQTMVVFEKRKECVYMVHFGLRRMLKDLRYVKRGGFLQASSSFIEYQDAFGRTLTYRLNGSTLEVRDQDLNASFAPVAYKTGAFSVRYFDKYNQEIPSPVSSTILGDIHWMEITLEAVNGEFFYKDSIQVFPREMFR